MSLEYMHIRRSLPPPKKRKREKERMRKKEQNESLFIKRERLLTRVETVLMSFFKTFLGSAGNLDPSPIQTPPPHINSWIRACVSSVKL